MLFRTVCEETLDWALREMRAPRAGFYSALDADSEGEEGKFYVWSVDEMRAALEGEPDADEAIAWFGATDRGNFEGHNIPVRGPGRPERLDAWRRRLYDVRSATGLARPRRQAADLLERADDRRARRGGRGARAFRLRRRRRALRRVRARLAARRGRPPAAELQGRSGRSSTPTSRTTPSCSKRCCPLRGELRPALVRRGACARRHDDRALRRRRARRLLRDLLRPRAAARAAQGPGGPSDPRRQLERGVRAAAPGAR